MHDIYEPAEDSCLLSKILKKEIPELLKENKNLKFLEIGSGSGIQLQTALKSGMRKQNIFSCDINPEAVKHCKKLGFNSRVSDLFENISGEYNVIVFNPPYLPLDERESKSSRLATTGGKSGSEIINEFLKQAKKYLDKNGRIFFVSSNLTKGINFQDYRRKIIGKEKLFFEELFIWELSL